MLQYFLTYLTARLGLDEEGQALAEYALVLALIAIVAIAALIVLGGAISDGFAQISDAISGATGGQ